ncbi:MAG: DMT family transporter [Bdellovibrionales bacterium]|nr:DMT family transporter [Bdellovibrionales bacterium]
MAGDAGPTTIVPYLLGLGSNFCFGATSMAFARFSKSHSSTWINQLKVSVAFFGFLTAFLLSENFVHQNPTGLALLLASGFVGLFIGDLFLFKAFAEIGPARTLVIFSFQPLLMAFYGYIFLDQDVNKFQFLAIGCMILCLITFVMERNKLTGKWHLIGFAGAFAGILLDSVGIVCTREAYEFDPSLGSFQANTIRAIGAMIGFLLLSPASYKNLFNDLVRMQSKTRNLALGACFIGTFVSLSLYLAAIKTAHVATLTAITITLPIWAGIVEHIHEKKWPNRYLWIAFAWFVLGFAAMIRGLHY